MKCVTAFMRCERLKFTQAALAERGFRNMTISEVNGLGEQKGHTEIYRGCEYSVNFIPKVRVELIVADEEVDACVAIIAETARTGVIGDGKIMVYALEQCINIRTDKRSAEDPLDPDFQSSS